MLKCGLKFMPSSLFQSAEEVWVNEQNKMCTQTCSENFYRCGIDLYKIVMSDSVWLNSWDWLKNQPLSPVTFEDKNFVKTRESTETHNHGSFLFIFFMLSDKMCLLIYQKEETGWRGSRAEEESHRNGLSRYIFKVKTFLIMSLCFFFEKLL